MQNTIGICSWTVGIDEPVALMKAISDMGLDGVQYNGLPDAVPAADVAQAAREFGLQILVYDPFINGPDKKEDATRENAIKFYSQCIDYALELGAPGLTLQGLNGWTKACEDDSEAWQLLAECISAVAERAEGTGLTLSLEPCNLYEMRFVHTAEEYARMQKDSGVEDLKILLDSFHMNIGEPRPLQTLLEFGSRNSIFHVSGSNREGICQGNIDFHAYFRALDESGFSGPTVFEFVLKDNPVNTAPRNQAEMDEFCRQVKQSAEIWRSYIKAASAT